MQMMTSVRIQEASLDGVGDGISYVKEESTIPTYNGMMTPWIEITEQPKTTAMRFRYQCEGRSAGTILGRSATIAQKTYPTIKIHNGGPAAVVVISCVTVNEPYHPHPHCLVGTSCKDGVCTIRIKATSVVSMMNVGIQCCKRNDVAAAMKLREQIRVDPFGTGYLTDLEKLNLSAVRLCFQVFLLDSNKKFSQVVTPAVSDAIIDKKLVHNLNICRLSRRACCAKGGDEVVLLCDKIKKDDIDVRFYEEDDDDELVWEAFGSFTTNDIHHQCAIAFKVPAYRDVSIESAVTVQIQLRRPSDNTLGEPKEFQYIPNGHDDDDPYIAKKRRLNDAKKFQNRQQQQQQQQQHRDENKNEINASQSPFTVEQAAAVSSITSISSPIDYSASVSASVAGPDAVAPILLQLTEDGRIVLPAGLRLLTPDGMEINCALPLQQQQPQQPELCNNMDENTSESVSKIEEDDNDDEEHNVASHDSGHASSPTEFRHND